MERNICVSIIIPMYNSEKNIEECLESILAQTFSNFEVLLIDDCSQDSTVEICNKYVVSDDRIQIICNESNCGPAYTRNVGLEKAKGSYICFVDSDDIIHPQYLMNSTELLEEYDADLIQYQYVYDKKKLSAKGKNIIYEQDKALGNYLKYIKLNGYVWGKVFRRTVINKLRFNNKLRIGEDGVYVLESLINANTILISTASMYMYRKHESVEVCEYIYKERLFDNCVQAEIVNEKSGLKSYLADAFSFVLYYRVWRELNLFEHEGINVEIQKIDLKMQECARNAMIYGKFTTKCKVFIWRNKRLIKRGIVRT